MQFRPSQKAYFFSQPHQPFFTLGIFNAIIFMALFIPSFRGHFVLEPLLFHSYSMIFLIFTNFFFGFLYTTFPRFSGVAPIEIKSYLVTFLFQLLATLTFFVSLFWSLAFFATAFFVGVSFMQTLKIFFGIYKVCTLPKQDQYWLIVGLGMGFMSNLLYLLYMVPPYFQPFYQLGVDFGAYLYLFFIAIVVAFRMVPFFSHVMSYQKSGWFYAFIFWILLLRSFLQGILPQSIFILDFIIGSIIARELIRIKLPFPNKEPLLWILHIALFWLPTAFFAGAISEFFEVFFGLYTAKLGLHLLALGFLTTLLIGFGTRVTLGHSGNLLRVDKAGVLLFYFTQVVLLGRLLFSFAAMYGKISLAFDIAATLWILLFIGWLIKYGKVLAFGVSGEGRHTP